jgi:hypothetical protein
MRHSDVGGKDNSTSVQFGSSPSPENGSWERLTFSVSSSFQGSFSKYIYHISLIFETKITLVAVSLAYAAWKVGHRLSHPRYLEDVLQLMEQPRHLSLSTYPDWEFEFCRIEDRSL